MSIVQFFDKRASVLRQKLRNREKYTKDFGETFL